MSDFGKHIEYLDKTLSSASQLSKGIQDEYNRIDKTIQTALQNASEEKRIGL